MSRLSEYFHKVRLGKPINYTAFAKECDKNKLTGWKKVFRATHEGKQRYKIEVINEARFTEWCGIFCGRVENRAQAARTGDSHRANTGASFLLRYGANASVPELVWLDGASRPSENRHAVAVLVENLENFSHIGAMKRVLRQWQPETADTGADWHYGAGNQIGNGLNRAYLSQYQKIYCLFDWDVGGLMIFRNLRRMLPETELRFALPENPLAYLAKSQRCLTNKDEDKIAEECLYGLSAETDRLIAAMLAGGKTWEQELCLLEE